MLPIWIVVSCTPSPPRGSYRIFAYGRPHLCSDWLKYFWPDETRAAFIKNVFQAGLGCWLCCLFVLILGVSSLVLFTQSMAADCQTRFSISFGTMALLLSIFLSFVQPSKGASGFVSSWPGASALRCCGRRTQKLQHNDLRCLAPLYLGFNVILYLGMRAARFLDLGYFIFACGPIAVRIWLRRSKSGRLNESCVWQKQ